MTRAIGFTACIFSIALSFACSTDPSDERPGFGLSGEVNQQPVQDWSFTSDIKEIFIETTTSYSIPHSVTAWCVTIGDELYVAADDADKKSWVANVARDPNVRLKIGEKIYEQKLVPTTDAATQARIDSGFAQKYEYEEEETDGEMIVGYWKVVERD
ncbi:MAG: DUF2255 family protein [Deltaproteobacteria bacterium]|nr:DUF2255 family protein [Deltaproteobacteria bacterium]MBW2576994.1 DUF2255 family protein [Deltaproteobacteria bacterium]MBW2692746.1 DUF2255 family protein [Deltaproteobacteria bacterium]